MFQNCSYLKFFNAIKPEKVPSRKPSRQIYNKPSSKAKLGLPNQSLKGLIRKHKQNRESLREKYFSTERFEKSSCDKEKCPIHIQCESKCSPTNEEVQVCPMKETKTCPKKQEIQSCPKKQEFQSCPKKEEIKVCPMKEEPQTCDPCSKAQTCDPCSMEVDSDVESEDSAYFMEQDAENLFNCSGIESECGNNWEHLDVNKKIIFFWASLKHTVPEPCPFQNFFNFYKSKKKSCLPEQKLSQKAKCLWNRMRYHEKLPFISEALINRMAQFPNPVTDDKVECRIKAYFNISRQQESKNFVCK